MTMTSRAVMLMLVLLWCGTTSATEPVGMVDASLVVKPGVVVATGLRKIHGVAILSVTAERDYLENVQVVPRADAFYLPLDRLQPCMNNPAAFVTWRYVIAPDHPNRNVIADASGIITTCQGSGGRPPPFEAAVVHVDLDVDSDNDSDPIAGQKFPLRTDDEDAMEWPIEPELPGLVLIVNRGFEEGGYVDPTAPVQDYEKHDSPGMRQDDQDLSRGVLQISGRKDGSAAYVGDDAVVRLHILDGTWQHWPSGSSRRLNPTIYQMRLEGIAPSQMTLSIAFTPDDLSSGGRTADDKIRVTVIDPHYQVCRGRSASYRVDDRGLNLTHDGHEMRFWLHNGAHNANVGLEPRSNHGDRERIANTRVLENFERLRIVARGVGSELLERRVRLMARWVAAPAQDLRLGVFESRDVTLTAQHVRDAGSARQQVGTIRLTGAAMIDGIAERELPNRPLRAFITGDDLNFPALWCATAGPRDDGWHAGDPLVRERAALGLVVWWNIAGTWRRVAWYRHLHLSLSDIRASVVHWTAGDVETTDRSFPTPALAVVADAQPPADRFYGVQDPDVAPTLPKYDAGLLFVHGYRMQTWERRDFASTLCKRFYWQRYGGTMGLFSWPTEYHTLLGSAGSPVNYDRSEFQARRSGATVLASAWPGIRAGLDCAEISQFHIMAHSMGNVVLGEALRANPSGQIAHNHFAMMSSESAGCYQYGAPLIGTVLRNAPDLVGPDVWRHADPVSPRSRMTWAQFDAEAPESLSPHVDGPVYYSGLFSAAFAGNALSYFHVRDQATSFLWRVTQNTRPDVGFDYTRVLVVPRTAVLPSYVDVFSQTTTVRRHSRCGPLWVRARSSHGATAQRQRMNLRRTRRCWRSWWDRERRRSALHATCMLVVQDIRMLSVCLRTRLISKLLSALAAARMTIAIFGIMMRSHPDASTRPLC